MIYIVSILKSNSHLFSVLRFLIFLLKKSVSQWGGFFLNKSIISKFYFIDINTQKKEMFFSLKLECACIEPVVHSSLPDKLLVISLFDYSAVVKNYYHIGISDG